MRENTCFGLITNKTHDFISYSDKNAGLSTGISLILKKSGVLGSDQGLSQLIGAGGLLHAAANTLNSGDDVVNIAALNQSSDALQVAVAAADELNILHLVVFDIEQDSLGAGALGLVFVHSNNLLCYAAFKIIMIDRMVLYDICFIFAMGIFLTNRVIL